MTISGISTNVQALLNATTYFNTVLPHPPEEGYQFTGYPSASHYYAGTSPEFATVTQNRRTIEYIVELYIVPDKATAPTTVFSEAYTLFDNVIQMFDQSIDLSSATIPLTRACDILQPVPGSFDRIETNEGPGLMCTIRLLCMADVAFR